MRFADHRGARVLCALAALMFSLLLWGCGEGEPVQVVLTTGFSGDEVFRIETKPCTISEVMVYLTNIQNRYGNTYGDEIWSMGSPEVSLEENIKDTVLNRLAQIKVMALMAEKYEVTLTPEEEQKVRDAGREYYESLSRAELRAFRTSRNGIISMYEDYALADKVYHYIIRDVNPEISDDEARIITINQVFISCLHEDEEGRVRPFDQNERAEALERARAVVEEAQNGENFENLIARYDEGGKGTASFGAGDGIPEIERVAFDMEKGQISDVIETEEGFYIIRCVTTFDRDETDANKAKIVSQKRRQVFGEEYSAFADTLTRVFNEELWEGITLIHDQEVSTDSFFSIYNSYFDNAFQ